MFFKALLSVTIIACAGLLAPSQSHGEPPAILGKGVSPESWKAALDEFKGGYMLLTFWEVTCEPCVEEMPGLIEVARQLQPKGLTICSVNTDPASRYELAAKLMEKLDPPFKRLVKLPGPDLGFRQAVDPEYGANPFAILLDPQGNKVKTFPDAHTRDEWISLLEPLIAKSAASNPAVAPAPEEAPVAAMFENPLAMLDLPDLGKSEPTSPDTAKTASAGLTQSGRSPFGIDSPKWIGLDAKSGKLELPFVCKQEAHLLLSTVSILNAKGGKVDIGKFEVSKLETLRMELLGTTEEILRTPGSVIVPLSLVGDAVEAALEMRITYQACTDGAKGACYPPETFAISGAISVREGKLSLASIQTVWNNPSNPLPEPESSIAAPSHEPATATAALADGTVEETLSGIISTSSLDDTTIVERAFKVSTWLVFLLAFVGGILTSFTPCVYPMIPATVAIFGAKEVRSKLMACSLAATYIMGVALSYASFGVLAAAVGTVFGAMMENPWLISIVAGFYIILALSMLDVFVFYLPSAWVSAASRVNRKGYIGAFAMGLVSSIVFAPCGEPILLGILAWVAKTQSFFFGFWLLFVYAWGIGVLFFVIATFSSSLQYLPKAGIWMVAIKDFFGLLLFGLAIYWLQYVLPKTVLWSLATLYFVGVASFIHTRNHNNSGWSRGLLSMATMVSILLAGIPMQKLAVHYGLLHAAPGALQEASAATGIAWRTESPLTDLAEAKKTNKPVIVDYRTNVCPKCDELEHTVFSHPEVRKALSEFVTIQVNLSNVASNKEVRDLQNRQQVFAVPVIEFYDSKGNYLPGKRIANVVTVEEFLKHIRDIG